MENAIPSSIRRLPFAAALLSVFCLISFGQSTDQQFPTPVTENEISGVISPRDVGDSRLTTYFYTFESSTGDLFVNIVTKNFTGDIDIFTASGLRSVTKVVVYADLASTETGRVLYFRRPEKLLLRIQGRTPGDEPATFRIKFAGTFVASTAPAVDAPAEPKVAETVEGATRVNSVGTIIPSEPKTRPSPVPKATEPISDASTTAESGRDAEKKSESKTSVVVTDTLPKPWRTREVAAPPVRRPPVERARRTSSSAKPQKAAPAADPTANIRLVILFKDGATIGRPMSEVLRFSVDRGILTVVTKDGRIGRYSILDVEKVTIQ